MLVRLIKNKTVAANNKPQRVRGSKRNLEVFATHKPVYGGGGIEDVVKDENNRMNLITEYVGKNVYVDVKKANSVSDGRNKVVVTAHSELIECSTAKELLMAVLKFNGYQVNDLLYSKKQEVGDGKLRLAVNTIVRFEDAGVYEQINLHEVVIKKMFLEVDEEVFNITRDTLTQQVNDVKDIGKLPVRIQHFDNIKKKVQPKEEERLYRHNRYKVFFCSNSVRLLQNMIRTVILSKELG